MSAHRENFHTSPKSASRRRRQERRRRRLLTRLAVLLLILGITFGLWRCHEPEDDRIGREESTEGSLEESSQTPTGWQNRDGSIYYFYLDGTLATGLTEVDGRVYYFGEDGVRRTGWQTLEDTTYFFRTDGTMAVGKVMIDGVARYFSSTGAYVVLVNRWNPIPQDYTVDLVSFEGWQVSEICYDALVQMLGDCPYSYIISSAYRSMESQQSIWTTRLEQYHNAGYTDADALAMVQAYVSVPGYSEHQLGLAIDISGSDEVCSWLSEHSWEYGFILRYPDGKSHITGIAYERWHFRYLGEELAAEIHGLGVTLEEYMDMCTTEAGSGTGTASDPEVYTSCAADNAA